MNKKITAGKFNYFAPKRDTKYCDEYVCLSDCQSAYITQNNMAELTHFLCTLPIAKSQSFSGNAAISYLLPVLWMTSCFYTSGPMACDVHSYVVIEHEKHNS